MASTLHPHHIHDSAFYANVSAPTVILGIGIIGYYLKAVEFFHAVPGDLGDSRFNAYVLEHVRLWLGGRLSSLWSPPFFYPNPGVLAFSDDHLGTVIFYAIPRSLNISREHSINIWFLSGVILNYFSAYFVLRRLGFIALSASVGAFVFTFGLPMLAQDTHIQLLYRFCVPPALYCVVRAFDCEGPLWLVGWLAFIVVQMLCSIYIGVFLLYVSFGFGLGYALVRGIQPIRLTLLAVFWQPLKRLSAMLLSIALCLVILITAIYPYWYYSKLYNLSRPLSEISSMLPRLSSYLLSDRHPLSGIFGRYIDDVPMRNEHQMFVGFGVLFLLIGGVSSAFGLTAILGESDSRSKRKIQRLEHPPRNSRPDKTRAQFNIQPAQMVKVCTICILFVVLITLSFRGRSIYLVLGSLPGINAIRAVTRVILVLLFPAAVLVAFGSETILALGRRTKIGVVRYTLLGCVVGLVTYEPLTYVPIRTRIADWRNQMDLIRDAVGEKVTPTSVLWVVGGLTSWKTSLDAMLFAQERGVPTLNGHSGNTPKITLDPTTCYAPAAQLSAWAAAPELRLISAERAAQILERIVAATIAPCASAHVRVRTGRLPDSLPAILRLTIFSVQPEGTRLRIKVLVRNEGSERIDAIAADGRNLRFSWILSAGDIGAGASPPSRWDSRVEIPFSLEPNGFLEASFDIGRPPVSGLYTLRISMVEEGVRWLHDHGFAPAQAYVQLE